MAFGLYILQRPPTKRAGDPPAPLATRAELLAVFGRMNTGPERAGGDVLYGPGLRVELPPGQDPVMQAAIHVTEDELFQSLFLGTEHERPGRLAREVRGRGWQLVNQAEGLVYPAVHHDDDDDDDEEDEADDASSSSAGSTA